MPRTVQTGFFSHDIISGVFCTNNAQAPSLFSNVTRTSRRSCVETAYHLTEEGHCCPKLFQHTIVCLLVLRWKRGRELVHCLYKKLQTCLPTSRRPAKLYLILFLSHFTVYMYLRGGRGGRWGGGGANMRHLALPQETEGRPATSLHVTHGDQNDPVNDINHHLNIPYKPCTLVRDEF